jgi:hypothetical protein
VYCPRFAPTSKTTGAWPARAASPASRSRTYSMAGTSPSSSGSQPPKFIPWAANRSIRSNSGCDRRRPWPSARLTRLLSIVPAPPAASGPARPAGGAGRRASLPDAPEII